MQVTSLKDVKPFKNGWKVHVKVLHTWKLYNAVHGDTLEFVLSDENGYKMHASCKKTYIESKGHLPVGAWRHIQNFSLIDHSYKMSIVQNTTITRSPLVNKDIFLSLIDFQSVLGGSLKTSFLIDVIGQVMELGELENIQCSGKPRRKVEFTLRDINDSRVTCCPWGKFTEILYESCSKDEEGMTICLIRFGKIGRFRGELQITNAFKALQVLINPEIPETGAFKEMFVDEDKSPALWESHDEKLELVYLKSIQAKCDEWLLFPRRTIRELLESTQVKKFLVICTAYAIDSNWGWYYFGCCICNKKVVKVRTLVKTLNGKYITSHIWWLEDPTDLPGAILSVIGKTFTFGISNSVNITECQEHIDGMSIPSTKQKGSWTDPAADITSTSKKPFSRAIKVEKMNDMEAEASKPT
ncbi:hypothetical protein N665_0591s0014 [Sinapis alba]|nr:hypothetical protein N665_0591s0014 [Sinapis alba]